MYEGTFYEFDLCHMSIESVLAFPNYEGVVLPNSKGVALSLYDTASGLRSPSRAVEAPSRGEGLVAGGPTRRGFSGEESIPCFTRRRYPSTSFPALRSP